MNYRPTQAHISLENIIHNYNLLKSLLPHKNLFFCPMVKANAYGHGAQQVVETLLKQGQVYFGLATLEEALSLEQYFADSTYKRRWLVFSPLSEEAFAAALHRPIDVVLSSWAEVQALEKAISVAKIKSLQRAHIKFNTGMSRLGFEVFEAEKISRYFQGHSSIQIVGVCTHLSDGEDAHLHNGNSQQQQKLFTAALGSLTNLTQNFHFYNSAGLVASCLAGPHRPHWGARPGISLYGIKPEIPSMTQEQEVKFKKIELKPVMSIKSKIIIARKVRQGEGVSYNRRWKAPQDSIIGVVPMGYADGYHRRISSQSQTSPSYMIVNGQAAPVVGTICMDYTMIDLTNFFSAPELAYGVDVCVLGGAVRAEKLAEWSGTNAYEILTSVSPRVPRIYS